MLLPGTTILIPSGPISDPTKRHLFVVVARREGPPKQVLIVSISSIGNTYTDSTVVFEEGAHRFIQHQSYVRYTDARVMTEVSLMRGIENRTFSLHDDCEAGFLSRVIDGFSQSPAAKPFAVEFIAEAD